MFLKGYPLEVKNALKSWSQSVHILRARLASLGHLGPISVPLIISKFHNETHDPKGQENQIYTMVRTGRRSTAATKSQSPAVVKSNMFLKGYLLKAKNALKNWNQSVIFSGPV